MTCTAELTTQKQENKPQTFKSKKTPASSIETNAQHNSVIAAPAGKAAAAAAAKEHLPPAAARRLRTKTLSPLWRARHRSTSTCVSWSGRRRWSSACHSSTPFPPSKAPPGEPSPLSHGRTTIERERGGGVWWGGGATGREGVHAEWRCAGGRGNRDGGVKFEHKHISAHLWRCMQEMLLIPGQRLTCRQAAPHLYMQKPGTKHGLRKRSPALDKSATAFLNQHRDPFFFLKSCVTVLPCKPFASAASTNVFFKMSKKTTNYW